MDLHAITVGREAAAGLENACDVVATMTTAEITDRTTIQGTRCAPTIPHRPRRIATIGIVGVRTSIKVAAAEEEDSTGGSDPFCILPKRIASCDCVLKYLNVSVSFIQGTRVVIPVATRRITVTPIRIRTRAGIATTATRTTTAVKGDTEISP